MFVEVAQWAALISKIATFLFVDVALWAASILKNYDLLYLLNVVREEKQFYLLGVARPASGLSVFTSNCNARLRTVDFGR